MHLIVKQAMLSSSKSVESLRVGSSEGCVSISLNDSWAGKKLLDYIDHDYNLHVTQKEFQVCKTLFIYYIRWFRCFKCIKGKKKKLKYI